MQTTSETVISGDIAE
jgi:hypothetical protein